MKNLQNDTLKSFCECLIQFLNCIRTYVTTNEKHRMKNGSLGQDSGNIEWNGIEYSSVWIGVMGRSIC